MPFRVCQTEGSQTWYMTSFGGWTRDYVVLFPTVEAAHAALVDARLAGAARCRRWGREADVIPARIEEVSGCACERVDHPADRIVEAL